MTGVWGFDQSAVRRRDRLLDEEDARRLLLRGEYGLLSMQAVEGGGYGVPVNYVWDGDGVIYVHCAPEGRKLRCVEHCPEVSFCVVGRTEVCPAKFTTAYESVLVEARAVRVDDIEESRRALRLILEKYAPAELDRGLAAAEKSLPRTAILRLEIRRVSAKCKKI
ncbi:pyridoxamine 5'-phosphate oxidase family protein [Alistipes sp.]|uniref:pyridoxamine 5'-phosphate oxidase family protein n=1 Tax=Alistipes sp. TaxID=1872444 RepID=UPI003A83FCDA